MGEAVNLINEFKVDRVVFNWGPYNNLEKELVKGLDKKKIKYYSCIKELNIDNNNFTFYKLVNMTMKMIIVMLFIQYLMNINFYLWEMLE